MHSGGTIPISFKDSAVALRGALGFRASGFVGLGLGLRLQVDFSFGSLSPLRDHAASLRWLPSEPKPASSY